MKNKYVYRLFHNHKIEYDGNDWICDSKLIGYFTSKLYAQNIIKKYKNVIGFKDYPNDFVIQKEKIVNDDSDLQKDNTMQYIYELTHSFEDEEGYEIVTYFSVYSSLEIARRDEEKLLLKFPFSTHPEGFLIVDHQLNHCYWQEGFLDGNMGNSV